VCPDQTFLIVPSSRERSQVCRPTEAKHTIRPSLESRGTGFAKSGAPASGAMCVEGRRRAVMHLRRSTRSPTPDDTSPQGLASRAPLPRSATASYLISNPGVRAPPTTDLKSTLTPCYIEAAPN
jgi:hypothetical protein